MWLNMLKNLFQYEMRIMFFKLSRLMAYLYDLRSEGGHTIAKLVMDNEDDYLPRLPLESAIKKYYCSIITMKRNNI